MSVSLEQHHGQRNRNFVRGATRGIGLAIVRQDGKIWTQEDVGRRARTGRDNGLLSITFETQKVGESHEANVLGAVPEVVDDATLPRVREHLYTTDSLLSTPVLTYQRDGAHIEYAVAVVVYDGPDILFQPHVTEEARPIGWMDPVAFLERDDIRPLAEHAVGYLHHNGILDQKLVAYRNPDRDTQLVIPKGFVVSEFHAKREEKRDMIPGVGYAIT